MAAASTELHAGARRAGCAWLAATAGLALLAGGAARLLGAAPLYMGAVMAAGMIAVPVVVARAVQRRVAMPSAVTLMLVMCAMHVAPSYIGNRNQAFCMIVAGLAMLALFGCPGSSKRPDTRRHGMHGRASRDIALVAFLAGLSTGLLARFQFFAICGSQGGSLPEYSMLLAVTAVLGFIVDRSAGKRVLATLYVARGVLLAALAASASPALATIGAQAFLVLDCLTIPALVRLTGNHDAVHAGCPGAAHHVGMLVGAALATTPFFFGEGFVALFVASGAANLACALQFGGFAPWRAMRGIRSLDIHASR